MKLASGHRGGERRAVPARSLQAKAAQGARGLPEPGKLPARVGGKNLLEKFPADWLRGVGNSPGGLASKRVGPGTTVIVWPRKGGPGGGPEPQAQRGRPHGLPQARDELKNRLAKGNTRQQ